MKPPPFEYYDPEDLANALDLLAGLAWDASLLAGGQSLIPMLNMRLARPSALIDLRRVPGLTDIDETGTGLRIGAMVRASALERFTSASPSTPACLHQAIREIGHPQIRNRTTVGGNLAHADPASELPAVFTALGGSVTLESKQRGRRTIDAASFFQGVFFTAREPDEAVVEVFLPAYKGHSVFLEVSRRPGDFGLVGACVAATMEGGVARDVRIALSGAGDRPRRLGHAEAVAEAQEPTPERLIAVGGAVAEEVDPQSDPHASSDYRRHVASVLVRRALEGIAGQDP
jgi:carbon-monoxide dehydrogenase medium subunit